LSMQLLSMLLLDGPTAPMYKALIDPVWSSHSVLFYEELVCWAFFFLCRTLVLAMLLPQVMKVEWNNLSLLLVITISLCLSDSYFPDLPLPSVW
jgi:hypothetical protein